MARKIFGSLQTFSWVRSACHETAKETRVAKTQGGALQRVDVSNVSMLHETPNSPHEKSGNVAETESTSQSREESVERKTDDVGSEGNHHQVDLDVLNSHG